MSVHWQCGNYLFTKDLIFGLCVQVDGGWKPLSELASDIFDELANARRYCQNNFPWQTELQELCEKRQVDATVSS